MYIIKYTHTHAPKVICARVFRRIMVCHPSKLQKFNTGNVNFVLILCKDTRKIREVLSSHHSTNRHLRNIIHCIPLLLKIITYFSATDSS